MTKELGSALAKSVRQVKTKQPQNKMLDQEQQEQKVEPAKSDSKLPLPSLPSKRVWPD